MKPNLKIFSIISALTCVALTSTSNGAIMITFSAEGDNTRVSITGSINTSGLTFSSPVGGSGTFSMRSNQNFELTSAMGEFIHADHGLTLATWHSIDSSTIVARDITGKDFGVFNSSISLPESYSSGSQINTDFLIEEKLSVIDPQSGVILTLGNGDTVSVSTVPEPTSLFLLGLSSLAVTVRRNRRIINQ